MALLVQHASEPMRRQCHHSGRHGHYAHRGGRNRTLVPLLCLLPLPAPVSALEAVSSWR